MLPQQPVLHPLEVRRPVTELLRSAAHQLGGHLPLGRTVYLPRQIRRHGGGELLRLRRLPRPGVRSPVR